MRREIFFAPRASLPAVALGNSHHEVTSVLKALVSNKNAAFELCLLKSHNRIRNKRLPIQILVRAFSLMNRITKILTTITAGIFTVTANAEPLSDGAALPNVVQKNQDGQSVNLAEAGAKGYVLVYFYPKADTPGCTKQACSLRDSYAALTEKGVKIFGVSTDSVAAQKAFKDKYKLPFDLLADEDGVVVNAFGVPKTMGFAKRQAYLFKDAKLVWKDTAASTEQQAVDVLKVISEKP